MLDGSDVKITKNDGDCYQFDKLHRTRKYAKQNVLIHMFHVPMSQDTHSQNSLEQMNKQTEKKLTFKNRTHLFLNGFFHLDCCLSTS